MASAYILLAVCPSHRRVSGIKIRVANQNAFKLGDRFIIPAGIAQYIPQISPDDQRKRIEFFGASDFGNGFVKPLNIRKICAEPMMSGRIIGFEFDGAAVFLFGLNPVPFVMVR